MSLSAVFLKLANFKITLTVKCSTHYKEKYRISRVTRKTVVSRLHTIVFPVTVMTEKRNSCVFSRALNDALLRLCETMLQISCTNLNITSLYWKLRFTWSSVKSRFCSLSNLHDYLCFNTLETQGTFIILGLTFVLPNNKAGETQFNYSNDLAQQYKNNDTLKTLIEVSPLIHFWRFCAPLRSMLIIIAPFYFSAV